MRFVSTYTACAVFACGVFGTMKVGTEVDSLKLSKLRAVPSQDELINQTRQETPTWRTFTVTPKVEDSFSNDKVEWFLLIQSLTPETEEELALLEKLKRNNSGTIDNIKREAITKLHMPPELFARHENKAILYAIGKIAEKDADNDNHREHKAPAQPKVERTPITRMEKAFLEDLATQLKWYETGTRFTPEMYDDIMENIELFKLDALEQDLIASNEQKLSIPEYLSISDKLTRYREKRKANTLMNRVFRFCRSVAVRRSKSKRRQRGGVVKTDETPLAGGSQDWYLV